MASSLAPRASGLRPAGPLVAVGAALVATCYGLARFAYGLLVPTMRADLHLSAATVGWVGAGAYAGYCVAILVAGRAATAYGPRRVAVTAGTMAAAGMAVIAVATGPLLLACGVVLAGASTGAVSPALAEAVSRVVTGARRDSAQTVVNAGTGIGVLVSSPVAALLAGQWRGVWAAFAVVAALVTLAAARNVPAADGADRSPAAGRVPLLPPRSPAGTRLVLLAAAVGLVSVATWTFGRDLVQSVGGLGPRASTLLWAALGLGGILAAAGGTLTRRLGVAASWRVLVLLLAGSTAALAAWPGGVAAYVSAAAFGAAYVGLTGVILVGATRVWPDHVAAGVGLGFLALAAGQTAGSPVAGALVDRVGLTATFWVAAATGAALAPIRFPARPTRPSAARRRPRNVRRGQPW